MNFANSRAFWSKQIYKSMSRYRSTESETPELILILLVRQMLLKVRSKKRNE